MVSQTQSLKCTKQCTTCKQDKELDCFYPRKIGSPDGYRNSCKLCESDAKKERVIYHQRFMNRYRLMRGCDTCGFKEHSAALDFAHISREGKEHNYTAGVNCSWSMERIKAEIRKCKVLCSNCHRIESYYEGTGNNSPKERK